MCEIFHFHFLYICYILVLLKSTTSTEPLEPHPSLKPGGSFSPNTFEIPEIWLAFEVSHYPETLAEGTLMNFSRRLLLTTTCGVFAGLTGCGSGSSGSSGISSLTVSPTTSSLVPGGSRAFTYVIQGTSADLGVVWSVVEPGGGSVDQTGLYTAPSSPGTYHVKVASHSNPSTYSLATISVAPSAVNLQLTTHTLSTAANSTVNLAQYVTVTGTFNVGVIWTVQSTNGGTVNAAGIYTAPSQAGTYIVKATSAADPSQSDMLFITVVTATISISPTSITLGPGATGTFGYSLKVVGSTDNSISWFASDASGNKLPGAIAGSTAQPDGSSITTSGSYTAPSKAGTYYVTVASNALPTVHATATVTVN